MTENVTPHLALSHRPVKPFADYMLQAPAYQIPRGAVLYNTNDPGDRVFLLRTGIAKLHAASEHGTERTIRIVYAGETTGEPAVLAGQRYRCTCTLLADASVSWMPRQQVLRLLETVPDFSILMVDHLARKLVHRTQATFRESFLSIDERVALVLLDLISSQPGAALKSGGYQVNVTHQEVANLIGSSRVSVTNALQSMSREKLVEMGRSHILVRDLIRLKAHVNPPFYPEES